MTTSGELISAYKFNRVSKLGCNENSGTRPQEKLCISLIWVDYIDCKMYYRLFTSFHRDTSLAFLVCFIFKQPTI